MWKDFFFFSASQRIAVIFLLSLIVIVMLVNTILPHYANHQIHLNDTIYQAEFEAFKNSLILKEESKGLSYDSKNSSYADKQARIPKKLFSFNPNTLDSVGFVTLGLKPYVASNILKYRAKGGVFRNKESFARIYGVTEDQFSELEKYIDIGENREIEEVKKVDESESQKAIEEREEIVSEQKLSINLNTATADELIQIKGIGQGYAQSIIRYRQLLGGYVHITQLKEVYGMSEDTYEKIQLYLTVDSAYIQKININIASVEKLKSHPYINFYQAKQIYEYRRKRGKLHTLDDLRELSELSDSDLERLERYLEFK